MISAEWDPIVDVDRNQLRRTASELREKQQRGFDPSFNFESSISKKQRRAASSCFRNNSHRPCSDMAQQRAQQAQAACAESVQVISLKSIGIASLVVNRQS